MRPAKCCDDWRCSQPRSTCLTVPPPPNHVKKWCMSRSRQRNVVVDDEEDCVLGKPGAAGVAMVGRAVGELDPALTGSVPLCCCKKKGSVPLCCPPVAAVASAYSPWSAGVLRQISMDNRIQFLDYWILLLKISTIFGC